MKKIVTLFLCFALFSPCVTFAKTDKAEREAQKLAKEQEKAKAKSEKEAAKEKAKADKKLAKDLKSKGWALVPGYPKKRMINKGGQNVEVVKNIVKIQTYSQNGSLSFSIAGRKGMWIPIIETTDFAESTYISLFVDDVEYRLNRSKKVDYNFVFDSESVEVCYTIEKLAQLKALYFIQDNTINVTYTVLNLDAKAHVFGIKAVYNTVLGENHTSHFTTPSLAGISSETSVMPSAKNYAIISSNEKQAARFVIYGEGVTPPKKVALANKNVIEDAALESSFRTGRSFSSVLSYNNSSMGLFWDSLILPSQGTKKYSYKISVSNPELKIDLVEDDFSYQPPVQTTPVVEDVPVVVDDVPVVVEEKTPVAAPVQTEYKQEIPEQKAPEQEQEQKEESSVTWGQPSEEDYYYPVEITPEAETPSFEETKAPDYIDNFGESSNDLRYDFNTERNYLDPSINEEYVRSLIDEIDALERNDPALNREKIQELQNEIDEVLQILRSRR